MSAKVSIVEVPALSAPVGVIEEPIAILTSWEPAFQAGAFQSDGFQMIPLAVVTDSASQFPAAVTIIEVSP